MTGGRRPPAPCLFDPPAESPTGGKVRWPLPAALTEAAEWAALLARDDLGADRLAFSLSAAAFGLDRDELREVAAVVADIYQRRCRT